MKYIIFSLMLGLVLTGCECPRKGGCSKSTLYGEDQAPNGFLMTSDHLKHGTMDDQGQMYIQDRVYFGFDEHALSAHNQQVLKRHVQWLKMNPDIDITVAGHCDARGTREYNIGLGERRAYALKSFFTAHGISEQRVRVVSKGKDHPLVEGSGETIWAQNRAAVITRS